MRAVTGWWGCLGGQVSASEPCLSLPAGRRSASRGRASSFRGFGPCVLVGLLLAVLLANPAALANNECGDPPTSGGEIICDGDDQTNAGSGIKYSFPSTDTDDYTIKIQANSGGTIKTGSGASAGSGADGIYVEKLGTGPSSITLSGGSIHTKGNDALGIHSKTSGNTASIVMSGGSIDTEGERAHGIQAFPHHSGPTNTGNINIGLKIGSVGTGDCMSSTGSGCDIHTIGSYARGIFGDAEVEQKGPNYYHPSGTVDISMSGGDILTEGRGAHGIHGRHEGTGKLTVNMTGGTITTTGNSAYGIYVQRTWTGDLDPVVVENSTISAAGAEAIRLNAVPAKILRLRNSTIERGNAGDAIWFSGNTDDTLTVLGHEDAGMTATTTIGGDVAFGGGTDRLVFNACLQADVDDTGDTDCTAAYGELKISHTGMLIGLENISKIGSGTVRLGDLTSRGSTMALEDGDLRLTGHLDLGASGTLTIHDASRLIFGATYDDQGQRTHGKITAEKVKFDDPDWQRLFMEDGALAAGDGMLLDAGKFYKANGITKVVPGLYDLNDAMLTTVSVDGIVQAVDGNECGDPVSGTVTCNEFTYIYQTDDAVSPADPGIEYEFSDTNDYIIKLQDGLGVDTTEEDDSGLFGMHRSGGDFTIAMSVVSGSDPDIHTEGDNAHGIHGMHSGTGDIEINMKDGRIRTTGRDAYGIYGRRAANAGCNTDPEDYNCDITIRMSGGTIDISSGHGIAGTHRSGGDFTIAMSVVSGSDPDIHTEGDNAHGIHGMHSGTGDIEINMKDGRIRTTGRDAYGIYGRRAANAGCNTDPEDYNCDITIRMSGGTIDISSGHGIAGTHRSGGDFMVMVSGATISSAQGNAINLNTEGTATVEIGAGTTEIRGNIAGADKLIFNPLMATDELTFVHTGMITGAPPISKIGSGTARLTDLGAAGAMMSLEDGDLRLTEAVLEGYPVRRGSGPDGRSVRFGLRGGSGTRAVSLDMDLRLGASVAPLAEAFSDSRDESAEVELTGEVYAAGLGWRGDAFFSDVALAHGRSRVSSRTLEATGLFRGSFDVKQTHAEARTGRLFPAGGMRITPSVSVFAGSLDHGGHTAEGAVMRAEIPGYSQDYRGCRAGVEVATAEWLELSPRCAGGPTCNWIWHTPRRTDRRR